MSYTNGLDKPSDYFNTALYTGNYSTNNITSLDFQPDLVWIKKRSAAESHILTDVVRGTGGNLYSNSASAEDTGITTGVTSFNSDGFSLGANNGFNQSGATFVSWNWKAGTSFTNDASATGVGTIDSVGSTNQTAGFSIVSWTGTGSAGTVAHNLGSVPEWYIIKNRSDANNWAVYHHKMNSNPEQFAMYLDGTSAATDDSGLANDTAPTSTVFSLTNGNYGNQNTYNYIGYFFSEVKGYSKFGSYTGNGSTDGTFTYLGFKPAFVMVKPTTTADNWVMFDNKRLGYNPDNNFVYANKNFADNDADIIDFTANGFKQTSSGGTSNRSGDTFIYMAFAENPFTTSTGVPACAR